jgi:hypothetical protein
MASLSFARTIGKLRHTNMRYEVATGAAAGRRRRGIALTRCA